MSSNRPAEPGRSARGFESWPLRRRLIVEQIILLAMVCVVIVAVTELALQAFLTNQLDGQLQEAKRRVERALQQSVAPPGPGGPPAKEALLDSQGPETLTAVVTGDRVRLAGRRNALGDDTSVPESAYSSFVTLPTDGDAYTRTVGDL